MELITGTWGGTLGADATPRTSLKFDSKTSTGMGSSLVVNPRGVRSATTSSPRPSAGADYELLEVIGKGGMGVVYSARQASVDRLVAVKMIRPQVAADAHRREKFLSEAVVTGDLDHPNIVPIYELGTNENNALFYSMKRVQGTPWSEVIGKKSVDENLEILMKVADAVAFAHANGVIHRDLKPDNVMLGDFGEVLVMDWGLALATASFRHGEFVTGPDSMGGTPAYMAPEMATGPFELIGPPSDIYLLGALLFEIVTGLTPHQGETAEECLLAAARNEIQPTEETGELIDIAYRAMATEPAERYASVQEFQAAIRDYHSHCESISLATRADQELAQRRAKPATTRVLRRPCSASKKPLALWDGNERARGRPCRKPAWPMPSAPRPKSDYELGLSLLDADDPRHAGLRRSLRRRSASAMRGNKWLSRFKRIAAALVLIVFGVITVALFVVGRGQEPGDGRQGTGHSRQDRRGASRARSPTGASKGGGAEEQGGRRGGQGQRGGSRRPRCRRPGQSGRRGRTQAKDHRHRGREQGQSRRKPRRVAPSRAKNTPPTWRASAWPRPRSKKTPSTRPKAC